MKRLLTALMMISLPAVAEQGVMPVSKAVDLQQYAGLWYEIASIPQSFQKKCLRGTTAEYTLVDDATLRVVNSCETKNGLASVEGRAVVTDDMTNAKLKVSFKNRKGRWVFDKSPSNYMIVDLAPDYSWAVAASPGRKGAWILAREPKMSIMTLARIESRLVAQGIDTCRMVVTPQDGGFMQRAALCDVVRSADDVGGSLDVLSRDRRFTRLVSAIYAADLHETLKSEGPFTIFAPTNEAFARVPAETLKAVLADKMALRALLLNHIVMGEYTAAQLAQSAPMASIGGAIHVVRVDGAQSMVGTARVISADIETKNGLIHVIDTVLVPGVTTPFGGEEVPVNEQEQEQAQSGQEQEQAQSGQEEGQAAQDQAPADQTGEGQEQAQSGQEQEQAQSGQEEGQAAQDQAPVDQTGEGQEQAQAGQEQEQAQSGQEQEQSQSGQEEAQEETGKGQEQEQAQADRGQELPVDEPVPMPGR